MWTTDGEFSVAFAVRILPRERIGFTDHIEREAKTLSCSILAELCQPLVLVSSGLVSSWEATSLSGVHLVQSIK